MRIMVEFHGFWNLPCAVEIARALEPYNVTWLEEMCLRTTWRLMKLWPG